MQNCLGLFHTLFSQPVSCKTFPTYFYAKLTPLISCFIFSTYFMLFFFLFYAGASYISETPMAAKYSSAAPCLLMPAGPVISQPSSSYCCDISSTAGNCTSLNVTDHVSEPYCKTG